MSPTIYRRQEGDRGSANRTKEHTGPNTTAILIAGIVLAVVVILSIIAFLFYNRQGGERQYREACRNDPYLTRKEFARRKRLSAVERIEEDEMQRSIMIRKSLTSRTSSYPIDSTDADSDFNQAMAQVPHSNLSGSSDWAPSTRRCRAMPDEEPHPGTEFDIAPPPVSRSPSPSPSRSPLLSRAESSFIQPPHPNEFGRPYHGLPSTLHQPSSFEAASRDVSAMAPISGRGFGNTRRDSRERSWFARAE
ncbi:hypothetical protein ACHAQH_002631 [Verticillium albo-atrum]